MGNRVVVTGLGCVSPLGNDVPTTWEACSNGKSGIDRITHFDPEALRCQIAGEVKKFQLPVKIKKKKSEYIIKNDFREQSIKKNVRIVKNKILNK